MSLGFHVCNFTEFADLTIVAGAKTFRFEFSKRFGPALLGKRGQIAANPHPGKFSPFWPALEAWIAGGYRVSERGECIYELPPERVYVQLVGRHFTEVPDGADPQQVRREWFERMGLPLPSDRGETFKKRERTGGTR